MSAAERAKGMRRERELVALFRGWGLRADRVPLSGAMKKQDGTGGHDIDLFAAWRDAPFIGEAKGRRRIPAWLREWLGDNDFLAIREDRSEWLFVLPERVLRELLGKGRA